MTLLIETDELEEIIKSGEKVYIIDYTISPNPNATQADI